MNGRSQAVRLPKEFRLPGTRAKIRRLGDGILLQPVREASWPRGYFDKIVINDRRFRRPPQGGLPDVPALDA